MPCTVHAERRREAPKSKGALTPLRLRLLAQATLSANGSGAILMRSAATLLIVLALGACSVGPDYHRPDLPVPEAYKEDAGWHPAEWKAAHPADALDRGTWWEIFGDPLGPLWRLRQWIRRIVASNQFVLAAVHRVVGA